MTHRLDSGNDSQELYVALVHEPLFEDVVVVAHLNETSDICQ